MVYRVEVLQSNVFYIEADDAEAARESAIWDYSWDENQQGRNSYSIGFNIEVSENDQ